MKRTGNVYMKDQYCGKVSESDDGYSFAYDSQYLQNHSAQAISCTLPLTEKPYHNKTLFAFFDGLIPEGWLLNLAEKNWKINYKDHMGLLLACCKDCIGAVSIRIENEKL
jgi:serine/threonine-protein kinase HipA